MYTSCDEMFVKEHTDMEWPCREDEKLIVKKVYVDRVEDADWRGRSLGR